MCLFYLLIFLFTSLTHSSSSRLFVQAFLLFLFVTGSDSFFILLKHLGFADRPITSGFNFSLIMLAHNATHMHSLAFVPLAQSNSLAQHVLMPSLKVFQSHPYKRYFLDCVTTVEGVGPLMWSCGSHGSHHSCAFYVGFRFLINSNGRPGYQKP